MTPSVTLRSRAARLTPASSTPVHVKVVTEAGTSFLLGIVTQAEAEAAINVARTTSGVKRVVNLMEIISPAKAREIDVVQKSSSNGKPAEVRNP